MNTITIHEIQQDPLAAIRRVEAGETLVVVRDERAVAEIKPVATAPSERTDGDSFQALVREWKATRGHTSSAARMAKNAAYQKIVDLGETAVPLILAELRKEPDHWFLALHAVTGADPVPPESRGNLAEMAQAWLAWGKERGYIKWPCPSITA